jgi:hypothetical protein
MGASTAPTAEFLDAGKPIALPFYLVDTNGNTLAFSTIAGNVNLNQVGGAAVALGQTTMSASIPVVLASNSSVVPTNQQATATGGATPFHLVSAGSANNTNVKASAGSLYGYSISNTTASTTEFVKFFNKATAPAAGTDTPIWTVQIAGSATVTAYFSTPIACSAGLGLATVTGAADNSSTGVSAGDLVINVLYA